FQNIKCDSKAELKLKSTNNFNPKASEFAATSIQHANDDYMPLADQDSDEDSEYFTMQLLHDDRWEKLHEKLQIATKLDKAENPEFHTQL
ncbi:MAG TPA: hypothetical protein VFV08_12690, partial [Puia sp.]|nr:hypothetical protein [Puia sp.]